MEKQENIERVLNCKPSRNTENDWVFDHAAEAGIVEATPSIPGSKDLREAWWDIGDQLNRIVRRLGYGRCGSAVAFCESQSIA